MKIDKAIKILQELERHSSLAFSLGELDAIKLGIEALRWFERCRRGIYWDVALGLPGETEE